MFDAVLASLVSFFLIDQMQAEMSKRLAAAGAPQAIVTDVASCARVATPALVERASGDPWWAATTAFGIWVGSTTPDAVLVQSAPVCGPAIEAARPFLAARQA